MSYVMSGFGALGVDTEWMSPQTFPIGVENSGVASLQRELQRLRFLSEGSSREGADGRWGPRTATALRAAARYAGWEGDAFRPTDATRSRPPPSEVQVPQALLELLRTAAPAPAGTPGAEDGGAPVDVDRLTEGHLLEQESSDGWIPAAVIGGGVLLAGAWLWYSQSKKPRRNKRRTRRSRR